MSAYLIVNYTVENPDLYKEYQGGAGGALNIGTDCQLLVLDPKSEAMEGSPGHQTVVLQYDSKEKALESYKSGAYQAVVGKRLDATSSHFAVIVDGMG